MKNNVHVGEIYFLRKTWKKTRTKKNNAYENYLHRTVNKKGAKHSNISTETLVNLFKS